MVWDRGLAGDPRGRARDGVVLDSLVVDRAARRVLLLRHQDRLVLAPLYGARLLALGELGQRSLELRGLERVGSGVVRARLAAVLALAGLGACGAAVAAIAVTIAPGRSVGLTALGTVAVLGSCATIVMLARRRHPQNRGDEGLTDPPGGH